jgi:tRNA(fMet)-specific endonuclease VapC
MAYLLDTTPLAALVFNRPAAVRLISPWLAAREAATSVVVYGEVVEYLRGQSNFSRRHGDLLSLLSAIDLYHVRLPVMQRYAEIRRQLRPPHGPGLIGEIDTIIAATALEYDLTLVTTDTDFTRVPGLKLLLLDRATLIPRST